ncbi:EpsG family protein [Pseudoalteromonas arctica]|uniref:EpsG family protein n=1 Tax=Pseudoalteromonas arctica TaxID=394751 RepID=A0ABU9TID2_9GAMM
MLVYSGLVLICFYFLMLVTTTKKIDFPLSFILVFLLFLISGFRYEVGTDYDTYVSFIKLIKEGRDTYMEPGFELMVKMLTSSGFETQSVFLISSLITLTFFFLFILRYSENYTLSVVIFFLFPIFYLASFNGVRQFIAVSIFLYSLKFILDKKVFAYITLICIGALFHKTILLMLPLYFILGRRASYKSTVLIIITYIFIASLLPFIGRALGFPDKYFTDALVTEGKNYKALAFPCFFIVYCCFEKQYKGGELIKNLTYNMLFIGSLISITPLISTLPSAPVIRMSSYFTPIVIIFLSNFSLVLQRKESRALYLIFILIISFTYFYSVVFVSGVKYNLNPYLFNFNIF